MEGHVPHPVQAIFHVPLPSGVLIEVFGAGEVGGHAGDPEDDLFTGSDVVEAADVDAGNGMGGYVVPAVLGDAILPALPLSIVPMYFELDGTFPNQRRPGRKRRAPAHAGSRLPA